MLEVDRLLVGVEVGMGVDSLLVGGVVEVVVVAGVAVVAVREEGGRERVGGEA
jgi:hypothetical protein